MNYSTAREAVSNNFVNSKEVVDVMELSMRMCESQPLSGNLIMWGPGGYGKSEMASMYIESAASQKPFIVTFHEGMTTTDNAGGVDVKSLQGGELRYLLEYSFMNHEYVIFEEAFDARASVVASLKQTLTSGVFSFPGIEPFPIKTKCVFIATNTAESDYAKDASAKALIERFPLRKRVDWGNLTLDERRDSYDYVINKFGGSDIDRSAKQQYISIGVDQNLSPRMLAKMAQAHASFRNMLSESGQGYTDNNISRSVISSMGYELPKLTERDINEQIFKERMIEARRRYASLFGDVDRIVSNINKLSDDELEKPSVIAKYARQIVSSDKAMAQIEDTIMDIRIDPSFGHLSDEIASYANNEATRIRGDIALLKEKTWDFIAQSYIEIEKDEDND